MTDILQTIEEIISNKYDFKISAIGGTYCLEETKTIDYPKTILKQKPYVILGNSFLKNKLLRAGDVCYLDNLCF